ncbi:MADS-box_protein [Hexamita inflata]|uniref:MADS-box protein n=1 Tax=Hexamita inflata TaxID=28002 RepID=A0AA86PF40_9EUKA|nr:MADS-box protein [Hexamita inflata]
MGRKKILIKKIESDRSRITTLVKRRNGLFKKGYELATLCDCQVTILIQDENGKKTVFTSSADTLPHTLQRFQAVDDVKCADDFKNAVSESSSYEEPNYQQRFTQQYQQQAVQQTAQAQPGFQYKMPPPPPSQPQVQLQQQQQNQHVQQNQQQQQPKLLVMQNNSQVMQSTQSLPPDFFNQIPQFDFQTQSQFQQNNQSNNQNQNQRKKPQINIDVDAAANPMWEMLNSPMFKLAQTPIGMKLDQLNAQNVAKDEQQK